MKVNPMVVFCAQNFDKKNVKIVFPVLFAPPSDNLYISSEWTLNILLQYSKYVPIKYNKSYNSGQRKHMRLIEMEI